MTVRSRGRAGAGSGRADEQQLRIIGGRWRGRKVSFSAAPGLRPTGDRIRETLFNWLQPVIEGARCLDLFAGSGALGLEALSRGAGEVVFVETSSTAVKSLRSHLAEFGAEAGTVLQMDGLAFLASDPKPFDVVFLDPPYHQDLLGPVCTRLQECGWLGPGARVYMEVERERCLEPLPPGWQVLREKTTGQVRYGLAAGPL